MDKPWFAFYASRWLEDDDVLRMTLAQRGAYIHLLARQWNSKDGKITDDKELLRRRLDSPEPVPDELLKVVLRKFESAGRGFLRNQRLHREWLEAEERGRFYHRRAKHGASARWGGKSATPPEPDDATLSLDTDPHGTVTSVEFVSTKGDKITTPEPAVIQEHIVIAEDSSGPPQLCPACGKPTHQRNRVGEPTLDSSGVPYVRCRALKCAAYGFMLYEDGHGFHPKTKVSKQFFEGPKHEESDEDIEAETGLKVIRKEKKKEKHD